MFSLLRKKYKSAFIHVPKTGGTYVVQHESDDNPVIDDMLDLGHSVYYKNTYPQKEFPPKFGYNQETSIKDLSKIPAKMIFANVRNPFDWLVSYWFHAGGKNKKYHDESHYDFKIAQQPFTDFIQEIAHRDNLDYWPSKRLIFFSLFEFNGAFIPNWINRTGMLDDNLAKMAKEYELTYTKKKKQRVGRPDRNYQKYYDQKTKILVEKTWARELKLFGYTFEGYHPESALIKNHAVPVNQRLKYLWEEDKLLFNNKLFE